MQTKEERNSERDGFLTFYEESLKAMVSYFEQKNEYHRQLIMKIIAAHDCEI